MIFHYFVFYSQFNSTTMLKNLNIVIAFIIFPFLSYCQFKNPPKINAGLAYRPGAIELSALSGPGFPPRGYVFKGYNYNNNPYLVAELSQKLNHQRWAVQLSNYLTYRYFVTTVDTLNNPVKDLSSFKYDCFVDVLYELRLPKNNQSFFYIGAGIGFMNIGKKFMYQVIRGNDINGKEIYGQLNSNLAFLAPRISFGYAKKNVSAWLIAHGTPDSDLESNPTIWAECKLLYSFQLKKKK